MRHVKVMESARKEHHRAAAFKIFSLKEYTGPKARDLQHLEYQKGVVVLASSRVFINAIDLRQRIDNYFILRPDNLEGFKDLLQAYKDIGFAYAVWQVKIVRLRWMIKAVRRRKD